MTGARYKIGKISANFRIMPNRNIKVFQTRKKYQNIKMKWRIVCAPVIKMTNVFSFPGLNGLFGFLSLPIDLLRSMKWTKTDRATSIMQRMRNVTSFLVRPPADVSPSAFIVRSDLQLLFSKFKI